MSSSSRPARPTKLKFKGESKKRKRSKHQDDGEGERDESEQDEHGWVIPPDLAYIRGPVFVTTTSSFGTFCIAYDSIGNRLRLASIPDDKTGEPTDVSQVWVATRVAGTDTVDLRTGNADGGGKFISCDAHGIVSSDRSARGPQESWEPEKIADTQFWSFKNNYGKYLGVDEVAGGNVTLRGDAESVEEFQHFRIFIQKKFLREIAEEKKDAQEKPPVIDEVKSNAMFQNWGMGRSKVSSDDTQVLKKARKEGRLAEAMLDRRSKLKSDRFC